MKLLRRIAVLLAVLTLASSALGACENYTCYVTVDTARCALVFGPGTDEIDLNYSAGCRPMRDCDFDDPNSICGVWCEYDYCYDV